LAQPTVLPRYYSIEEWAVKAWWKKPETKEGMQ
jgi:hypothetical protein